MGPLDRELAQRRGRRKLDAMRRRTGQLRRRVVATAVVGFALLWTVVFVQMATGNDPVLKPSATSVRSAAQESVASDPERRALRAATAPPPPAEEPEELEAVTTSQS